MTNGNGEIIDDIQSYPILTEDVGAVAVPRPGGPGAPLGASVSEMLHRILGWRPRPSDPKGFAAALLQSFTCVEEEGRKKCVWTPHTYTIQADLGAVTGAQASIYQRARAALDQSLPLLAGLKPLQSDADLEDIEASRSIVESGLVQLVNEMGQIGGPRVQRVESLFDTLLGENFTGTDPELVRGQLALLRERFGLKRHKVNTVEEEHVLTNYLILVDNVISLKRSWDSQRHFFDRTDKDVFLGTQLVLLSRALAVVVESVQQARFAMNSVFLGEAERQASSLTFAGVSIDVPVTGDPNGDLEAFVFPEDTPSLTIAELLEWVDLFASEEGLRLIRSGGKDGVISWRATLDMLRRLVRGAWKISKTTPANPARGFHTPRVQRVLEELTVHLDQAFKLSDQITREPLEPQPIKITEVTFAPTGLTSGDILIVSIKVRNDSDQTIETQGPNPGFSYDEGDDFRTHFPEEKGRYRVGVDFRGREDEIDHPYRWGFGASLEPGEERTITGGIVLTSTGDWHYWAGLVHEEIAWLQDGVGEQHITVVPKPM